VTRLQFTVMTFAGASYKTHRVAELNQSSWKCTVKRKFTGTKRVAMQLLSSYGRSRSTVAERLRYLQSHIIVTSINRLTVIITILAAVAS